MKTEYYFAEVLKKMMETTPLDGISVTTLSKKCGVSRKTFYYHYRDVYDLLTQVFLNEKITETPEDIKTTRDLIEVIYKYYSKNSKFIDATLDSAGKDLFKEFVFNFCYQVMLKNFITPKPESKKLTPNEKKDIVRYYSFAYSNAIAYYLSTHKSKSLNGLLDCFFFVNEEIIQSGIMQAKKGSKK